MTLKLDWFGFAEGAANDARGVMTLVGFAPQFLRYKSFPATSNLALVVLIEDDEDPEPTLTEGKQLLLALTIKAPDGKVVLAHQPTLTVGEKKDVGDLPGRLNLVLQLPLTFSKPGEYTASITVQVEGSEEVVEADRTISILEE
jgi:hypothetical protein